MGEAAEMLFFFRWSAITKRILVNFANLDGLTGCEWLPGESNRFHINLCEVFASKIQETATLVAKLPNCASAD